MDLWSQHIKADGSIDMPPERLTTGVEMRYATFSSDGTRLVYSKGKRISNVWRVPILEERPATWSDAQQITFDQAFVEFVTIKRFRSPIVFFSAHKPWITSSFWV